MTNLLENIAVLYTGILHQLSSNKHSIIAAVFKSSILCESQQGMLPLVATGRFQTDKRGTRQRTIEKALSDSSQEGFFKLLVIYSYFTIIIFRLLLCFSDSTLYRYIPEATAEPLSSKPSHTLLCRPLLSASLTKVLTT